MSSSEDEPEVTDLFTGGPEDDEPMSFFDHLTELRSRLIRAAIGIAVGFAVCWIFVDQLNAIIKTPLAEAWTAVGLEGAPQLQVLGVLDAFLTNVRIAVTAAIFVSAPIIFYQVWMFVSPGLYAREKRYVIPFAMTSAVMFLVGAAFCYKMVLPYATEWFLRFPLEQQDASNVQILPQYTFPDYTTYTTKLLLGFGLMFEFPLAVFFLAAAGLITHRTLLQHWKVAILLIFVASAFLTPPDPITLTFMAVPMVGLFFASVGVAYLVGKKNAEETALVPVDDESGTGDGPKKPG